MTEDKHSQRSSTSTQDMIRNYGRPSARNKAPYKTHGGPIKQPALKLRQRDLWMTYVAQKIVGPEPQCYPPIDDTAAITSDECSILEQTHKITVDRENRIKQLVRRYLPCPEDKIPQVGAQILKLCVKHANQYPYDLVLLADREMKRGVAVDHRIGTIVCECMLKIYDDLIEGRRTKDNNSSEDIKSWRLSLRRVLVRFCKESDSYPPALTLTDIKYIEQVPIWSGAISDIYRGMHSSGYVALKTFRSRQNGLDPKEFSQGLMTEVIFLSRLKHDNLLECLGLYKQSREELEIISMVSPWMDCGTITQCRRTLMQQKTEIPRLRWISEVACGLRYLHDEYIIHGDLHDGNILVDNQLHVHIAGFGLSVLQEPTSSAAITREPTDNVSWWSAPELLEEGVMPTRASDVWAFGCACLSIWTGQGPFQDCRTIAQLARTLMVSESKPDRYCVDAFRGEDGGVGGATLRADVVLPCWSRVPGNRPSMQFVGGYLEKVRPIEG